MRWALVGAAIATLSCSRDPQTKFVRRTTPLQQAPQMTVALSPLLTRDFVDLPVPGHLNAVVAVPVGATTRRPIVLGVHGNYETPEAFCTALHDIIGTHAFLICVRGTERDDWPKDALHYTFVSPQILATEVDDAINALYERFPAYVDFEALMYVGFSRGAFLSVAIIATEPSRFPRAILIEGGQDAWTPGRISYFAAAGGSRILFACGTDVCHGEGNRIATMLKDARVDTRVVYGADAGHAYTGRVAEELKKGFDWVVEGDPRWK
jgi:predicted esterase